MVVNPHAGDGAGLAAALVNLAPSATEIDVAAAMVANGTIRPAPSAAQARVLLRWARELAPVFGESAVEAKVALVNGLLARSASKPHVSQHDGRPPHLHFAPDDCDTVAGVQAFTAAGLALVVCADPDRLGRCAAQGCDIVFVDVSRNGRRRFCSTTCATRTYVADHRARVRSAR
jgi:predicted RNA-binding Zn ribbon-like protein